MMRIKEITENYISNRHMGLGSQRADDQRIMEKPRTKSREKQLKDNTAFGIGDRAASGAWANSGARNKQM